MKMRRHKGKAVRAGERTAMAIAAYKAMKEGKVDIVLHETGDSLVLANRNGNEIEIYDLKIRRTWRTWALAIDDR